MSLNKRQWDILCKLQSSDRPLSVGSVAKLVGKNNVRASDRSFREMIARDLRDLKRITGAIESDRVLSQNDDGRGYRESVYSWKSNSPTLLANTLSSAQSVALGVLQKVGMGLVPQALTEELKPLFKGIHGNQVFRQRGNETITKQVTDREVKAAEQKWLQKIAVLPEMVRFQAPSVRSEVEMTIHEALYNERLIEIQYREKKTLVKPLALVQQGVRRYLVAISRAHGAEPRTFAMFRIESARMVNVPGYDDIKGGEDFQLQDYLKPGLAHPVFEKDLLGTTIELELWVDEGTYGWMKETPLEDNQTAEKRDDGYLLKITTVLQEGLVYWILSMAHHVKVMSPDVLRQRVAKDLQRAASLYR